MDKSIFIGGKVVQPLHRSGLLESYLLSIGEEPQKFFTYLVDRHVVYAVLE
jgi:hypothetical protein